MNLDYDLVKRLREQAGERLQERRRAEEAAGRPLTQDDMRVIARDVIADLLQAHALGRLNAGLAIPGIEEEDGYAAAVHAALFGVGRLQPLLDDEDVENVNINGCDNVFVGYADGRQAKAEPIAASDDDLIKLIQTLAATSGLNSRPWDEANPELDLQLPGGYRLSAVMGVSHRPALSIRRARLDKVLLADLRENGTITPELENFLSAAVLARRNIVIAGATNAGKTTLLKALANVIPPEERLVTVERALELGLHELTDLHPNVVALEERLPNLEGQGRVSMADLVRRSLRMDPSRVIVGEVLGDEIVSMLNAMSQGNDGSLSTIHANSSRDVFHRISTYAIQAQERLPIEASQMLIAGAIEFVVFIKRTRDPFSGLMRRRVVSVREVNGIDGRVLSSEIFAMTPDGTVKSAAPLSDERLELLTDHGYRPDNGWGEQWS